MTAFGKRSNATAAVVVTWNRKEMLRQNIACLLAQNAPCDVLIVDNGSTDGTREMLEAEFDDPRLRYYDTGANLGGAGGFHVGIYWAATDGYDNIWIMDDDCLPSETALSQLLAAGERLGGDWGWLCSAIYWTDGEVCRFNRPKKDVFRHVSPEDYERDLVPAYMTSFVSVMFRADIVRDSGLPIAEYFIWTDDYEYTGRIAKEHPCYMVPSSEVTHAMKSNERPSLATVDEGGIRRFYYLNRNDVHCYRQHGAAGRAYLAAKAAYTAVDVALHASDRKAERLFAMFRGMRDGVEFRPRLIDVGNTDRPMPGQNERRDRIVRIRSRAKNNPLFRIVLAPAGQARYWLSDFRFDHSEESRRIDALKDSHIGEACFIVGNGPSLSCSDLDALSGVFTFGANRIYKLFGQTRWRPDVYLAVDREFIGNDIEVIADLPLKLKLVSWTVDSGELRGRDGIVLINAHAVKYTLKRFSNKKVGFSSNPAHVLYEGYTVTFVALQLALWMGFKDIYLIGMDHVFSHEVTPDGKVKVNKGISNHAYRDPQGVVINPQPREGVELAYRLARDEAERRGAHIYNATRGGALEVFERADLDEVIQSMKSEKNRG